MTSGLVLAAAEAAPGMQLTLNGGGSAAVKIFLLLTALSFASALLISITCFTRIVIVLSFLRQALGTPQLPPNQVIVALALAVSFFVMAAPAKQVYDEALGPYFEDRIAHAEAFERASVPIRGFLLKHTRERDLKLFFSLSDSPVPEHASEVPLTVAVPAFMVSELTTAFRMGLYVYIPLLIIDLLVASVLMSLGMMMVPPAMISLPLKVGIFLLADGWHLVVASLARSF